MVREAAERGDFDQCRAAWPVDRQRAAEMRCDDRGDLRVSVAIEIGDADRIQPTHRRADGRRLREPLQALADKPEQHQACTRVTPADDAQEPFWLAERESHPARREILEDLVDGQFQRDDPATARGDGKPCVLVRQAEREMAVAVHR